MGRWMDDRWIDGSIDMYIDRGREDEIETGDGMGSGRKGEKQMSETESETSREQA